MPQPWRGRVLNALKLWLTIRVFWLLLLHPVKMEDGSKVPAYRLVADTLAGIDHATFWTFCAVAAGVKFIGILASMYRWTILLYTSDAADERSSVDLGGRRIIKK